MVDFKALGAKAVANGADQTKAVTGGGDYAPPAAGPGMARFIGYVECGKQKGMMKGKEEIKEKVMLIFELVGKRHATDAESQPHRITVTETYSLNEKANFFKLFQRMNYRQDAQHIVQLLGEGYKVEVVHDTWKDRNGKDRIDATLRNASGYTIAPPRKEDEDSETGWVDIAVPQARSDLRCFLWNEADMEQWGSLYIEGEYPERKDEKTGVVTPAKSKNTLQNKIKGAVNFIGSPIHTLLVAGGVALDLPNVGEDPDERGNGQAAATPAKTQGSQTSSTTSPSNDALGGII
jgi:hypothetical protein